MKALVYLGPNKLEIQDVAVPKVKEKEVMLRVKACGICGSDVHGYLGLTGRRTAPMIMGHEFSGEIIELGENTSGKFKIGDRVTVQPANFCGECENCKQGYTNVCEYKDFYGAMDANGALSEYFVVPEKLLYHLPENVSYEQGALIEAFAVSYSGVKKAGDVEGKNVFIAGGGTIGQLALIALKNLNPKKIVLSDLSPLRLEFAKKLGADIAFAPNKDESFAEQIKRHFGGEKADIAIEAVGIQPTVSQTLDSLKTRGRCVWIGNSAKEVKVDMQNIVTNQLAIFGTYIYTHEEFGEAIKFIGDNNVDLSDVITKVITLEEAPAMFEELGRSAENHLKVVVKL